MESSSIHSMSFFQMFPPLISEAISLSHLWRRWLGVGGARGVARRRASRASRASRWSCKPRPFSLRESLVHGEMRRCLKGKWRGTSEKNSGRWRWIGDKWDYDRLWDCSSQFLATWSSKNRKKMKSRGKLYWIWEASYLLWSMEYVHTHVLEHPTAVVHQQHQHPKILQRFLKIPKKTLSPWKL